MTARNRNATPTFCYLLLSVVLASGLFTFGAQSAIANDEPFAAEERRDSDTRPKGEIRRVSNDESVDVELNKRVRVLQKGASSRTLRRTAMAKLPLDRLSETDQERAVTVLQSASMFRELPLLECDIEPDVYEYFAAHPDVAVSIWRAMKISTFQMTQTADSNYDVDSGDGTTGKVEVLFQSDDECLAICTGKFKTPLVLKPINATGLFHLQSKTKRREDGTAVSRYRGRMFVAFPSQAVGTVAKVISPVSNVIIDRNFREVSLFVHMMSTAMQRQPGWIERMSKKLDGVPDKRKVELLKLTARMYVDSRKRRLIASGDPIDKVDIEELLPPTVPDNKSTRSRVVAKPKPMAN